jgi:hypothetical protein
LSKEDQAVWKPEAPHADDPADEPDDPVDAVGGAQMELENTALQEARDDIIDFGDDGDIVGAQDDESDSDSDSDSGGDSDLDSDLDDDC